MPLTSRACLIPLLASLLSLSLGTGCAYVRRAKTPMETHTFVSQGANRVRGAIVLLPGFGDGPTAFEERGFVAALKRGAPDYDIVAADAHFGYYRTRSLIARLDQDVIGPLRQAGYRELWLVGASMGGHGAVAYARVHPERIAGLLLFAPYMGPREVVQEVQRAGGLCQYRPPSRYVDDQEGFARANFGFLRERVCDKHDLSLWVAVGQSDGLHLADAVLGKALEPARFLTLPGGHGWKVWTPAVERIAPRALSQ